MLIYKIKQLCMQKDITITELERILQFGNGTIHRWHSSSPSIDKAKAVATYFGVTIDSLINDDSSIPNQEALNMATEYLSLTPNQMGMVKLYISILTNGQTA